MSGTPREHPHARRDGRSPPAADEGGADAGGVPASEDPLVLFGSAPTVEARRAALPVLIATRQIHHAEAQPHIDEGVAFLLKAAGGDDVVARLQAIATLVRLSQSLKGLRKPIEEQLRPLLVGPLAPLGALTDPDDRRYVAMACAWASGPWVVHFVANAAVEEESAEETRAELLRVLFCDVSDVTAGLRAMSERLSTWMPGTEAPRGSLGRRLRRIAAGARDVVARNACAVDADAGRALAALLALPARFSQEKSADKDVSDLGEAACGLLHEIIRRKSSLAREHRIYEPVTALRGWFIATQWVRFVGRRGSVSDLRTDLEEAITMLATQGSPDGALYKQLVTLCGSERVARERTIRIADEASVPPEVQAWLRTGTLGSSTAPSERQGEARDSAEQVQLALLLLDASAASRAAAHAATQVLPELEILAPRAAADVKYLAGGTAALADALSTYLAARGLRLRFEVGESVEFSPLLHESPTATNPSRLVRIMRPAVERVRADGVRFVVLKAITEPE